MPHYDGSSHIMGYVDAADGREVATFEYGPFGEALRATGSLADDLAFRFSTKPTDDVTGHVHYQLRVYDPLNGRWLSRDPIGENGGLNLYGFVGNDPVNGWDYLGNYEQIAQFVLSCAQSIIEANLLDELHERVTLARIGKNDIANSCMGRRNIYTNTRLNLPYYYLDGLVDDSSIANQITSCLIGKGTSMGVEKLFPDMSEGMRDQLSNALNAIIESKLDTAFQKSLELVYRNTRDSRRLIAGVWLVYSVTVDNVTYSWKENVMYGEMTNPESCKYAVCDACCIRP